MSEHHAMLYVRDLVTSEQFILWAVRSWVEAYTTQVPPLERLAKGFDLAGMPEGLFALDEMLTVIAVSSRAQIDVRCRRCASIGDGEIAMLRMLVAAQAGRLNDLIPKELNTDP